MTEKRNKRKLKLVKSQIQEVNQVIEEMLGRKIDKELWNCIQTLIMKHNNITVGNGCCSYGFETKVKPIIDKYKQDIDNNMNDNLIRFPKMEETKPLRLMTAK